MLNKMRLLTPGPSPIPERIRLVMAQDMIHHRKAEFCAIMEDIQKNLRALFGTTQAILPLSSSGTGAMVAAISGLFSPREKVLVVDGGAFGKRWGAIASMHGLEVITHVVAPGQAVVTADIATILQKNPDIRGVLVQLSETSTGVMHPVWEMGALLQQRDTLLLVDGISGVSISPCPMDAWGIDCLVTGSQKGFMLPPGLALLSCSARAWEKAQTITQTNFYFNIVKERERVLQNQTCFTSPVGLIMGLQESLRMFMEAGLDTIYTKQWALSCMARTGIQAMGLKLFAPVNPAWGLTAFHVPAGLVAAKVLQYAVDTYGVTMAGGQEPFKASLIRLGHMGWVDWADIAAGLAAVAGSIRGCGGYIGTRDYIEQALFAYEAALEEGHPLR